MLHFFPCCAWCRKVFGRVLLLPCFDDDDGSVTENVHHIVCVFLSLDACVGAKGMKGKTDDVLEQF